MISLSKGECKLLKYSNNEYCNLVRVNTLHSTNRNQWSIYMTQTNIFATRTGDHSRPRHVIFRDPLASASTVWQAMGRVERVPACFGRMVGSLSWLLRDCCICCLEGKFKCRNFIENFDHLLQWQNSNVRPSQ